MKTTLTFLLVRRARKSGGDRYEADLGEGEKMTLYIPQKLSRSHTTAAEFFEVTFDDKFIERV